jgi:hypothetical protein
MSLRFCARSGERVRFDFLELRAIHVARRRHGHAAKDAFVIKTWKMFETEVAKLMRSRKPLNAEWALRRYKHARNGLWKIRAEQSL